MLHNATDAEVIRLRSSRRTFQNQPFSPSDFSAVEAVVQGGPDGKLGTPMTFTLVSLEEVADQKLKLGTYGFIQGARHFIAGQIAPSRRGFLDYGYALECKIIQLTRLGLGTCWLGGTFNRGEFARAIQLKEGHVIPAITPVGYPTQGRGWGERLIRLGAGSNNRMEPGQLFFDQNGGQPINFLAENPIIPVLESVRLGPSASNNQPWRITQMDQQFNFHICRKPGYQKAFSQVDMQMIDMGIAMAHFDRVSAEMGFSAEWKILEGTPPFKEWEYVISVFLRK